MDLRTLYLRDLTFTGCTVVAPDTFGKLVGYIERGEVSPFLAATYPLAQLQEAQAQFIRKQHIGNIVVTMDWRVFKLRYQTLLNYNHSWLISEKSATECFQFCDSNV